MKLLKYLAGVFAGLWLIVNIIGYLIVFCIFGAFAYALGMLVLNGALKHK